MKVRRAMNERHTAIISLPFKKSDGLAGSTNNMEMFRVTSSDIYAWAPRIGTTLKYNNAKVKAMSVSSVSTASLSTIGTHAIWTTFDQQVGNFPATGTEQENNSSIQQTLAEMQQTGQFKIGSAVTRIDEKISIPAGVRSFNFQDVANPTGDDDSYNATTIAQVIRIYPKNAIPVTSVNLTVEFSGLGPAGSTATVPSAPADFDQMYDTDDVSIVWLKDAYDTLARALPIKAADGSVTWHPCLFVVVAGDGIRKMLHWKSRDDATLAGSWDFIFFPRRHAGGKLSSELTELCYFPVGDARLDHEEIFYAHAPADSWEFDASNIAAGLYVRPTGPKSVHQRDADEILSSAVSNHAINVNLGISSTDNGGGQEQISGVLRKWTQ